ncbi:lipopolysaccharide transport periplasmic protein LptA [Sulfurimonas sp. MAG313]|nr:lipopolysaccharide transport periplasmic protein LptA [Sulfurimonas sp. MAG313]MDF1880569.1 lipopolysaccharide transport periplasmic protein LptA [Sulfurimonas sp. MAG313]
MEMKKKGITTFNGNVHIIKGKDELNASKVVVLTNKDRTPYQYTAQGDVSFYISMPDNNASYRGDAGRVVYYPLKKEYQFYTNVHLYQVGTNRKIFGEEVILNAQDGNARAIGKEKVPVIMIFNIPDSQKDNN